jgi:hypothetical protein
MMSMKSDKKNGYFTWWRMYVYYFVSLISSSNEKCLWRNCIENQNTYFMFNNFLFENHAVYEMMWKEIVVPGKLQMIIWRMRIACWISNTAITHSEYVIIIVFPQQQCLNERASMSLYTQIACLVMFGCTDYKPLKSCRLCSRTSNMMMTANLYPTDVNNNLHFNGYNGSVCVCGVCVCVVWQYVWTLRRKSLPLFQSR